MKGLKFLILKIALKNQDWEENIKQINLWI